MTKAEQKKKQKWSTRKLGDKDILKMSSGGTPLKSKEDYYGGNILWLGSGELDDNQNIFSSKNKITEQGLRNSSAKIFPAGTVLIAMYGATAGKLGILEVDASTNQAVAGMICNEKKLFNKYLYYVLLSIRSEIINKAWGGAQPNISQTILKNIEIPLPPLEEQKRIVGVLEEKLGKVKEAIKLREDTLADTEKILPARLSEIFAEGKENEWEEKTIDEICEVARGGSPRPIKEYLTSDTDGINWIKIGDASSSTKYIYETKEKIKPEGLNKTRQVKPGDLLLTNSMSFGRPYILKTAGAIHDGWLLISPDDSVSSEYLYHFLSSNEIYAQFKKLAGGAVVQNLNSSLVKGVKISIPDLKTQEKIVAELDELSARVAELRAHQETQLADLRALERAYLHEAFASKL